MSAAPKLTQERRGIAMNITMILTYLFGALANCLRASIRTREMVARAIAKFLNMVPV